MEDLKGVLLMTRLLRRCSLLLAFGVLCSAYIGAQAPRVGDVKTLVVIDESFEPQQNTDRGPFRRGRLRYEVWITTDGVLHCKTSKLLSASVMFTPPVIKTATAGGGGTSVGGGKGRLLSVDKSDFADTHYTFDIKPDKYRQMHSITLTIRSGLHGSAEVKLINKKVPAEIQK